MPSRAAHGPTEPYRHFLPDLRAPLGIDLAAARVNIMRIPELAVFVGRFDAEAAHPVAPAYVAPPDPSSVAENVGGA